MAKPTAAEQELLSQFRPATADHLVSQKKPVSEWMTICLDTDLIDEYERAKEDLAEATAANRREIEHRVDTAREALRAGTVRLKLQGIGRKRYDALISEYPATDEQVAEARKLNPEGDPPAWDVDQFPQKLIQQTVAVPQLSDADVQSIYDEWNNGEITDLFLRCLTVNSQRRIVDLGNGFGSTRS